MVTIDVIVVTHKRPVLLERCLTSIQAAMNRVQGQAQLFVRVGINGEDGETAKRLENFFSGSLGFHSVQKLARPLSPAAARNQLVEASSADWLFFVDDDAYLNDDFFVLFLRSLKSHPDAGVIGGQNSTPPLSNPFQRASGAALTSRFAAGDACVRYRARVDHPVRCGEESLILCNLFILRKAMATTQFPAQLRANEENWVLQDLKQNGFIFIFDPSLSVWHERRDRPLSFIEQIYKYGNGRGKNIRSRPSTLNLKHLVPSICIVVSFICLTLAPYSRSLLHLWLTLVAVYLASLLAATVRLKLGTAESLRICLMGGALFPIIHLSYGFGVLRGLGFSDRTANG